MKLSFRYRLICCILAFLLVIPASLAESAVNLSSLSNDEIVTLLGKINEELVARGMQKTASLPTGKYVGGKDLPAGTYIITCKTDDSHHGIVWVSAPEDDLSSQYPSVLYEHVSFNKEEQFRVTIEEGGILNLPFAATLTISTGLFFQ